LRPDPESASRRAGPAARERLPVSRQVEIPRLIRGRR
jgi:hypothetical protein